MCGIVGIIGKDSKDKPAVVRTMAECIKHRGPDDDGFFDDEFVSLGMRRLSIIDITGGTQPIASADGNSIIFFNGEIYNYRELRQELESKGYVFKTDSDTETVLHIYEAYGKAGLSKLRGMFAFCIYDQSAHVLFLARDYFGIKPLYYFKSGNTVRGFASEIKALLEHPKYQDVKEVNDAAVFNYLRFEYNPLEETFFKDIFNLRPGHCMTVDLLAGTFDIEQYWKFEFDINEQAAEERTADKIREAMRDSVAHHMISDVPVGSFLSGGVDSSIIATLMNEVIEKEKPGTKNKTFTIGFNEMSEGSAAKETSDMLGTDHTEISVGSDEYFKVLPRLVWHFDEPVADPSAIALFFVARTARKKVKVVLSGEGADELFGGYNVYLAPTVARRLSWLPQATLQWLSRVIPDVWGKDYLIRASSKISEWYIGNASVFSLAEQSKIWKGSSQENISLAPIYDQAAQEHLKDTSMQLVDINTWLVGDILAKADKMTMANSLELRVPFLDMKVADVARTIPDHLKWPGEGQTKYILRKAFEKIVPQSTAKRRKLGFPTPIKSWLNAERPDVYDVIRHSSFMKSRFDMQEVEQLITTHLSGTDRSRKIYLLYILALWHQIFFETTV